MARLIRSSLCSFRSLHLLSSPASRQQQLFPVLGGLTHSTKRWLGDLAMVEDVGLIQSSISSLGFYTSTLEEKELNGKNVSEGRSDAEKGLTQADTTAKEASPENETDKSRECFDASKQDPQQANPMEDHHSGSIHSNSCPNETFVESNGTLNVSVEHRYEVARKDSKIASEANSKVASTKKSTDKKADGCENMVLSSMTPTMREIAGPHNDEIVIQPETNTSKNGSKENTKILNLFMGKLEQAIGARHKTKTDDPIIQYIRSSKGKQSAADQLSKKIESANDSDQVTNLACESNKDADACQQAASTLDQCGTFEGLLTSNEAELGQQKKLGSIDDFADLELPREAGNGSGISNSFRRNSLAMSTPVKSSTSKPKAGGSNDTQKVRLEKLDSTHVQRISSEEHLNTDDPMTELQNWKTKVNARYKSSTSKFKTGDSIDVQKTLKDIFRTDVQNISSEEHFNTDAPKYSEDLEKVKAMWNVCGKSSSTKSKAGGSNDLQKIREEKPDSTDVQSISFEEYCNPDQLGPVYDVRCTICVQNLPYTNDLIMVREAIGHHGEITGSLKKPTSYGYCDYYFQFKTVDAMNNALRARKLCLEGKNYPIVRIDKPMSTVVRISRVSPNTREGHVLSICGKLGALDTIKFRGKGVFDVYYKASELPNMSNIIFSLDEVTVHHSRWVAVPAPIVHPSLRASIMSTKQGSSWHARQMKKTMEKIEQELNEAVVGFEDLKTLLSMQESESKPNT